MTSPRSLTYLARPPHPPRTPPSARTPAHSLRQDTPRSLTQDTPHSLGHDTQLAASFWRVRAITCHLQLLGRRPRVASLPAVYTTVGAPVTRGARSVGAVEMPADYSLGARPGICVMSSVYLPHVSDANRLTHPHRQAAATKRG